MKKLIVAMLALFLASVSVHAQGLKAGIKIGANGTKIDGQSFEDGYKLSYQGGVFIEADFNKKFGIQPEVLFGQSTSKTVSGIGAIGTNLPSGQDIILNYLSIPVLLRYNVGKLITLNLGPQFAILLNKDNTVLQNGQQAFKSGDFSMVGGVQLNFSVLRIYGRYNVGLSNINDVSDQNKWKSQQLQLGVGFKL
ncbi:porin family protein [Parasediminibacterium paludis]|uniref:Porin family protein n=1 Tax=Parasediminibacterium paludis TaxID=908966 RepID=A0ABV8PWS1_9BACT